MQVQATPQPRTTGTTLDNRVCARCSTRLSHNNPDDVCQVCYLTVDTVGAPCPAESRQSKITGATANTNAVCDDCAGSGWDSSDYQIWCPTCGGTGEAEETFIVAPRHVYVARAQSPSFGFWKR